LVWRTTPVRGFSASTRMPTSIEVCQAAFTDALRVTTSPTWMGCRKVMRSAPAVTTRWRAWRTAARPATSSTSFMTTPPCTKPAELASVGPIQCTSTLRESATVRASTRHYARRNLHSSSDRGVRMPGMGGRMSTVIKAKISRLLDRAEDPGETLDYSYQKQLESLQNVKKGIADVVTAKKRLQMQSQKLEQSVVKLDTQARQALSAGNEDLARVALERKNVAQTELQSLDQQVAELEQQQSKLTESEQKLRTKIETFRTKKEVIKAQYSAAEAQVRISEAATGVGEQMADVGLAMQRAVDKTEQMRARADAVSELEAAGTFDDLTALGPGQDDIDRQLHELSSTSQVDDELAKMKAELGSGAGGADAKQLEEGQGT
jgi:phage shock protein A